LSATLTVRLPRRLLERMRRHREINWSEVVRRSIEEYLDRLEAAAGGAEPGESVAEELLESGLEPGDLEPLPAAEEERLAARLGELEWERTRRLRGA